eukprot:11190501-Lingulodinium_polyedra.AAC.1
MMLQVDKFYDPIFSATVPLVMAYASRVWEHSLDFGNLARAWRQLSVRAEAGSLNWGTVEGPLGALWLSLRRVGWSM